MSELYFNNVPITTKFVVKNVAPTKKTVRIFGHHILYSGVRNLMLIPGISESDIRHSLMKGDLNVKIRAHELVIVESNIDLLQFDIEQKTFLQDSGTDAGVEITTSEISSEAYNIFVEQPTPTPPTPQFDINTVVLEVNGSQVYIADGDIVLKSS